MSSDDPQILFLLASEFEAEKIFPGEELCLGKIIQIDSRFSLLISGPGPVNAALVAVEIAVLKQDFPRLLVLNLGICAAPDQSISIGSLFIPLSYVMEGGESQASLPALMEMCYPAMCYGSSEDREEPICLTLPAALRDDERASALVQKYKKTLLVEMEAYAYIRACYLLDVPFIALKAVSDHGRPQEREQFFAAAESALAALHRVFLLVKSSSQLPVDAQALNVRLQQIIREIYL